MMGFNSLQSAKLNLKGEKIMSEKLRVSDYLVYVYQNDKTFAYNRLLGNFQELDSNAILVIKAIKDDDISLGNKAFLNQTDTLQNLLDWQFVVIGDFDERKAILEDRKSVV